MLIDTDVLIWYLKGNEKARAIIEKQKGFSISVVTYIELVQGMRNKNELNELRIALRDWTTRILYINEEISDYPDDTFDYVILSQTLQQVYKPATLLQNILRIGKRGIVSFPNFSHWAVRLQLLLSGYAPVTRQLPFEWYDTPNIRVITLQDFRKFSREVDFDILREVAINTNGHSKKGNRVSLLSNLRATYGIFLIGKGKDG